jgi:Domain of unknown function (DUF4389)
MHPVHLEWKSTALYDRKQLLVRVLLFIVLGALGLSLSAAYGVLYLLLPIYAAIRMASLEVPERYHQEDGPSITQGLRWLAAVVAWLGFSVDRLPASSPDETISFWIDRTAPRPSVMSALLRPIVGLPSALALALLGWVGIFVWLWAALSILNDGRVGPRARQYLAGLQRWCLRLLAYQACLVDEYPPFSLADSDPTGTPAGPLREPSRGS